MTREEQIQKLIDEETGIDNYGSSDYQMGVCDGVRLADKTMIDKACGWLINIDYDDFHFRDCDESFNNDLFVDAFRKAMKGGAE